MAIVIHGLKGSLVKENYVSSIYEQEITGLWSPFRNTEQGVCFCGENNLLIKVFVAKAKVCSASMTLGLKGPEVTRTRPETA